MSQLEGYLLVNSGRKKDGSPAPRRRPTSGNVDSYVVKYKFVYGPTETYNSPRPGRKASVAPACSSRRRKAVSRRCARPTNDKSGSSSGDAPPAYSKLDLDAVEPVHAERFSFLDLVDNVMIWVGVWVGKLYLEVDECLSFLDVAVNVLVWSGLWFCLMVSCLSYGELGPILFSFYPVVAAVPLIKVF